MKTHILAAIIATLPVLSYAGEPSSLPSEMITVDNNTVKQLDYTIDYFNKKYPNLIFAGSGSGGQHSSCTSDADCGAEWVCISKTCQ